MDENHGVDGIMLGRAAYHTPWTLAQVDSKIYGVKDPVSTRFEALDAYRPYIEMSLEKGTRLHSITRHIMGLFQGVPGAKKWRQTLSEKANKPGAGLEVVDEAMAHIAISEGVS